ncbi:aldehyde dehydrogenase family protein [Bradyrhizobium manausense]
MKPYGVFAVIAPFNFPVALSIGMVSGALLTGKFGCLQAFQGAR